MSTTHEHTIDVDHHVKVYLRVFAALVVLTAITVAVSYLHLSVAGAIALALFIAIVKGSLVACYFMHLVSERRLIFGVMGLTVVFFFFELMVPMLTETGNIGMG